MEQAHRRELDIGGCIVTDHDPDYRTGKCAVYVYRDGEFELPGSWDYFDQLLVEGGALE